jgi:hypothetical protein
MSSVLKKRNGKSVDQIPVMHVQEKPTLQKPFSKTYNLYGDRNRRDAIIALIQQQHRGDPFVVPFVSHLQKIGKEKLDPYKKMEFTLHEFGVTLIFLTSYEEESEMAYPIADLTSEPDFRLKRPRTLFEWLSGAN